MKRFTAINTTLLVLAVVGMIMIYLFVPNIKRQGIGDGSRTIDESVSRGVFMLSYRAVPGSLRDGDSLSVNIVDVWTEVYWVHGRVTGSIVVDKDEEASFLCLRIELVKHGAKIDSTLQRRVLLVVDGNSMDYHGTVGLYSCVWSGNVPDTLNLVWGRTTSDSVNGSVRISMDTLSKGILVAQ